MPVDFTTDSQYGTRFVSRLLICILACESTSHYKSTFKSTPNMELGLRVDFTL